ncbi:MAG: SMP-30/gluconolactonase/LRE family protein [Phycisphaeraceae bacterium]|nr:SMP-30/gluconolactonase/LRE family protein [Phycisphaeraceae bacterium]
MRDTLEIVADDGNLCGEGPTWDRRNCRLLWNDLTGRKLFDYHPATDQRRVLATDIDAAGIALHHDGRLVIAGRKGMFLWNAEGQRETMVGPVNGEPIPFNDMIADAKGRLYAGSVYWKPGQPKTGFLHRVDLDGSIHVIDDDVLIANGLGFSLDQRTLYFADSAARIIYAYDVNPDTGDISRRRVFTRLPSDEGLPDGLTVDAMGFVWCAQWYGSQVVRYDPDGKVERRIKLPATQISSVAFGGDDLCDLYITSAGEPWPCSLAPAGWDARALAGGALYRVKTDIPGREEHLARIQPARSNPS